MTRLFYALLITTLFIKPLLANDSMANVGVYDYPIDNPLAATVIGTPNEYAALLPEDISRQAMKLVVFPDREIKKFMPYKALNYTLVSQKKAAPLIFSIAGIGAGHSSAKMRLLEKAFFQAGFHVVSLPSPTFSNFIMTASTTQVPGHLLQDSADLYRVMELVKEQIKDTVKVTSFNVVGYSLGGTQAAFVTKIDEKRGTFNFKKVLMINPPVNLFNSVSILDAMLESNIPGGLNNFNAFFNEIITEFSHLYSNSDSMEFNHDFLYRVYKNKQQKINSSKLAAIIGVSFRISSSNMIFTSDIATNGGYILPKNHALAMTESTTDYFKVASHLSFTDYYDERFLPFFQAQNVGLTSNKLLDELSLKSIADYLSVTDNIAVVHNEDDIILAPGEIDFFRNIFQSRAHIYSKGGHCGNMAHRDNIDYMVNYFKNQGRFE